MIPLTLKLRNFTAYGPDTPDLDFRPLQLVVLSGVNGAGKSSILDSITWAIWGWSRAGDNADQLTRLGQKEMWVDLTFELEGVDYQVVRTRKIGNPGSTTLSFFAGNGKTNLTEGTIKSTQEKIIQTLHLSYDTFVNSSYLRQGRADEFTLKSPNERKEILADILGLATYDQLEERAKQKAREAEEQLSLLDIQLSELTAELESSSTNLETQSKTEAELTEVRKRLAAAENKLAEVSQRREVKLKAYEGARVKADRVIKLQTEIANLRLELDGLREQIRSLQLLTAEESIINQNYTLLVSKRAELRKMDSLKVELAKLKDRAMSQERLMTESKSKKESELARIKSLGDSLTKQIQLEEAKLAETKLQKKKCPTCGQEIGTDEHQKIIREFADKVAALKKELAELRLLWAKVQSEKIGGQVDLERFRVEIARLEETLKPAEKIIVEVDQLTIFEDKKRELDVAAAKREALTQTGIKLKVQFDRLEKELAEEKTVDLAALQLELSSLDRERGTKDLEVRTLRLEDSSAVERLAEAKQLVSRATQVAQSIKTKGSERNEAGLKKTDYEDLAAAFGKKGIQAMLIESAIPEIEDEANKLLGKMTDDRMKIQLLTQRETKTAGIAETLDIVISDELGARSYEMYSGGEAFRINLAIRLALSRLLTHRAGAKLQFLIIDEGFGTQDAQGKYKVVEAINAIKDDFAKILVVTHDPELKEAFPQRIEVSRNSNGSTFEVFA